MNNKAPRQALSKAYLKSTVTRSEIERFKTAFMTMQSKVDATENEEHLKNVVRDFLLDAYYKGQYEINVKDRKDLVIHNGPNTSDSVGVIIEAKSIKNINEMVSKDNLNSKALQELILYYLREREDKKNINVKHLIITNAIEWFVFDENDFEKLIFRNKKLIKSYTSFKESGKDTRHFYESIAKPFIETIKSDLPYTWFDISKFKNVVTNDDDIDDAKLIALFKLLSPTHILKQSFANDSNSLNRNFYNELLHIIGLEEVKQKNKKLISRKPEDKRETASLLENTINILTYETNIPETSRYDTALELCITWINRLLFLKLLESQLIKYNKGNKDYEFLNSTKIGDYDTLNRLFFQVLAVKPQERRPQIQENYGKVPYLNSSLFEVNALETKTIRISSLEDVEELSIHQKTVLKDTKGKKVQGKINTLEYLFRFLDAYDFSSEGGEQIQEEDKTLINASVLGLIFEKINGYKDGSFFTPGFITMYMCRETLRRSVIQKFKDHTDFDSEDWEELKNFLGRVYKKDDLITYNGFIDSLKICDPAVGSGHFLVSALNELISIKSELGILCDSEYSKLPVIASVDNDELIIQNDNAEQDLYEYDYTKAESQTIQKALFEQKQTIIENCLFGVDINPNSVKICRLRLWIELLKNAYYTKESNYTDLDTLPNIDINIKCGNSLISRFDLDSDLKLALKKSKFTIDSYKAAVASYKTATNKADKQQFNDLINGIKSDFRSVVRSKELIDLQKLEGQFYDRFGAASLLDVELTKAEAKKKEKEKKKLLDKINKKKADIEEVKSNKIYENAFEWRFEFPEVLDDEGEYVGFDVVIGNPPYIRQEEITDIKSYLKNSYLTYSGRSDIYVFFYELSEEILSKNGKLCFISSNKFFRANYGLKLKEFIVQKLSIKEIIDFGELPVFEEASTFPMIFLSEKKQTEAVSFKYAIISDLLEVKQDVFRTLKFKLYSIDYSNLEGSNWLLNNKETTALLRKLMKNKKISEILGVQLYSGIKTGLNEAFWINEETRSMLIAQDSNSNKLIKKICRGTDIRKWKILDSGLYIIYTHQGVSIEKFPAIKAHLYKYKKKLENRAVSQPWWQLQQAQNRDNLWETEKILYPDICKESRFTLDSKKTYSDMKGFVMTSSSKFVLGVLNSKLIWWYLMQKCAVLGDPNKGGRLQLKSQYIKEIPIPLGYKIGIENKIMSLVNHCLLYPDNNQAQSLKIDQLVYQLYDLTPEEIELIENSIA